MKHRLSLLIAAALLAATPARADEFRIDPVHTQVLFSVDHLGFSRSHGRFTGTSGTFVFDEKAPKEASADITIKAGSLRMDDAAWDAELQGPNFLDVKKYPDITFKTTQVLLDEFTAAKVTGDLTLHGVTKPVVLQVVFNKAAVFPMTSEFKAGFSITGTIKRSDFGITYGLPGVGDDVALTIEVEGTRIEKGDKLPSAHDDPAIAATPKDDIKKDAAGDQ